jgi:small subunit ribosomal protein S2
MTELPGVLIVIDSTYEEIAVYEGQKLGIPLVAIVDTNANPENIDYPIPGNDDAIRSIRLFITKFSESVQEGLNRKMEQEVEQAKAEEAAAAEASETEEKPEEVKQPKQDDQPKQDKQPKQDDQPEQVEERDEETSEVKET